MEKKYKKSKKLVLIPSLIVCNCCNFGHNSTGGDNFFNFFNFGCCNTIFDNSYDTTFDNIIEKDENLKQKAEEIKQEAEKIIEGNKAIQENRYLASLLYPKLVHNIREEKATIRKESFLGLIYGERSFIVKKVGKNKEENICIKGAKTDYYYDINDLLNGVDNFLKIKNEIRNLIKCLGCKNVLQIKDVYKSKGNFFDAVRKYALWDIIFKGDNPIKNIHEKSDKMGKKSFKDLFNKFEQTFFIVTKFYERGNLETFIKEDKDSSIDIKNFLTYQMINAVSQVHEKGIVHMNIKPSNILLDENNNLFLTGFGLSCSECEDGFSSTYVYKPIFDKYWNCREKNPQKGFKFLQLMDIYALACTIYELWCGEYFCFGKTKEEAEKAIDECMPEKIWAKSKKKERIPKELQEVLEKVFNKISALKEKNFNQPLETFLTLETFTNSDYYKTIQQKEEKINTIK